MLPKDPEKMVIATAKAMALADIGAGTPRVVRHYFDDGRKVLPDIVNAAIRQGWELRELAAALRAAKPKKKRGEAVAPPRPVP